MLVVRGSSRVHVGKRSTWPKTGPEISDQTAQGERFDSISEGVRQKQDSGKYLDILIELPHWGGSLCERWPGHVHGHSPQLNQTKANNSEDGRPVASLPGRLPRRGGVASTPRLDLYVLTWKGKPSEAERFQQLLTDLGQTVIGSGTEAGADR